MIKRGKKGQFYLIAAIIIIAIISGYSLYQNYAKPKQTNTAIYDLGQELKLETGSVLDYGVYNSQDTSNLTADWARKYYEYSKEEGSVENWIFIYGNRAKLTALSFSTIDSGDVSIITGAGRINVKVEKEVENTKNIPQSAIDSGIAKLTFNGIDYSIDLQTGENFFFVIKGGGSVATN